MPYEHVFTTEDQRKVASGTCQVQFLFNKLALDDNKSKTNGDKIINDIP